MNCDSLVWYNVYSLVWCNDYYLSGVMFTVCYGILNMACVNDTLSTHVIRVGFNVEHDDSVRLVIIQQPPHVNHG